MDVCTGIQFAYDNPNNDENTRVKQCPNGLFGYNETKECIDVCPNGTYG